MNDTDEQLLTRAVEGDRDAFEVLIRRHFRAAWAVALAIVRDVADAEDVCQDAIVRAWERLHQCGDGRRLRGWLTAVVRSVAYNRIQRERVRATVDLDAVVGLASTETAARRAHQGELRGELLRALDRLTEAQRTVLLLSDLEQYRHREIAETLDISETMSRRHLSDARRRMRLRLIERGVRPEEA